MSNPLTAPNILRSAAFVAVIASTSGANRAQIDADPLVLETVDGEQVAEAELRAARAVVLAWIGLDCPMSRVYRPRVRALARALGPREVRFFFVDSNAQDPIERIRELDRTPTAALAIVHDVGGTLARRFGAERTTEIIVLDRSLHVRYRGAVDDQYGYRKPAGGGVGTYRKDRPTRPFLRDALEDLLAGREVATPSTDALGCAIGLRWKDAPQGADAGDVTLTFHRDVERIVQKRCQTCHRPGGGGPFSLLTYDDAYGWADTIREVVADRRMPPWNANPDHGKFANDRSLTEHEIDTLLSWIDQGAARGDPTAAPAPIAWPQGWRIGEPDAVLATPSFPVPSEGRMPYRYVRVRTDFAEDKWVRAAQIRSTGEDVVHHVLVFVMPPKGQRAPKNPPWTPQWHVMDLFRHLPSAAERRRHMLRLQPFLRDFRFAGGGVFGFFAAALPGDEPMAHDDNRASYVPAGATLVFQIHYTPNGEPTESVTRLGLRFADEPPEEVRHVHAATSVTFEIPPGEQRWVEEVSHTFQRGGRILSLAPHMHLRGKSIRYVLERLDGTREILLDVPNFDFDWQMQYVLATPIRFERGERLLGIATFDNSASNPQNPDPTQTVRFGLQTDEEMLIAYFEAIWEPG